MNLNDILEQHLIKLVEQREAIPETLAHLDQILEKHPRALDPQLLHFLQKRSYVKALTHLRQIHLES